MGSAAPPVNQRTRGWLLGLALTGSAVMVWMTLGNPGLGLLLLVVLELIVLSVSPKGAPDVRHRPSGYQRNEEER